MSAKIRPLLLCLLFMVFFLAASTPTQPIPLPSEERSFFTSTLITIRNGAGAIDRHAFYLAPLETDSRVLAFILTTAEAIGKLYGYIPEKNALDEIKQTLIVSNMVYDFSIGYIEEPRKKRNYFSIPKSTDSYNGEKILTVATAAGKFPVELQELRLLAKKDLPQGCAAANIVAFKASQKAFYGFRGAPVATATGKLIGLLYGVCADDHTIYLVTPIQKIMEKWDFTVK